MTVITCRKLPLIFPAVFVKLLFTCKVWLGTVDESGGKLLVMTWPWRVLQTAPDDHLLSGTLSPSLLPTSARFLNSFPPSFPIGSNRKVQSMSLESALRWPCTCADHDTPRNLAMEAAGQCSVLVSGSCCMGLLCTQVLVCAPAFKPLASFMSVPPCS